MVPVTLNEIPLDMSQYKKFFRSVRIPRVERDEFSLVEFDKKNNHIVLLHKNNVYKVNVTNNVGEIYQSKEIAAAIETTFRSENDEGANVGIFTTAERNQAAKVYDQPIVPKVNEKGLQTIADALDVICNDV